MKKVMNVLLVVLVIAGMVLAGMAMTERVIRNAYRGNIREAVCKVVEVNGDEVVAQDENGEEWAFGGSGYEVGGTVIVSFTDSNTLDIYDDQIFDVVKAEKP